MVKMSISEWEFFKERSGYSEQDHPVATKQYDDPEDVHPNRSDFTQERDRKEQAHREIDREVEKVKYRQEDEESRDYWRGKNKERERAEREKEEDRLDARSKQRAINRRAPPAPRRAPMMRARAPAPRGGYGNAEPGGLSGGVIAFGNYTDPFSGMGFAGARPGILAESGGIRAGGYKDPFAGSLGTPGRGGSFDLHTGLFSSQFGSSRSPAPRARAPAPARLGTLGTPGRGGSFDLRSGLFGGKLPSLFGSASGPAKKSSRRKAGSKR